MSARQIRPCHRARWPSSARSGCCRSSRRWFGLRYLRRYRVPEQCSGSQHAAATKFTQTCEGVLQAVDGAHASSSSTTNQSLRSPSFPVMASKMARRIQVLMTWRSDAIRSLDTEETGLPCPHESISDRERLTAGLTCQVLEAARCWIVMDRIESKNLPLSLAKNGAAGVLSNSLRRSSMGRQ